MTDNPRLLLAVDTSSLVVSASLAAVRSEDVQVVASRDVAASNRHGELLTALIHDVLVEGGVTPVDLAAIAVGLGPGPFTGLRVGVVTAAALADALKISSYGVCSLDAVAHVHAAGHGGTGGFLVCTDARRKQVYWARYDERGARLEGPDIGTPDAVAARFAPGVDTVVGAGVALYPEPFAAFAHRLDTPAGAGAIAKLVADNVRARAPSDVMEPMYLRRPDAAPPGRPKSVLPA